jgi:hypothetical protein
VLILLNSNLKTTIFVIEKCLCPLTITGGVCFIILDIHGVVTMEPEEHKGFMIVEAPGWMFKATKIVQSPHFKHSLNACTVESLKIFINFKLNKMKPVNRNKSVNRQG